MAYYNYSCNNDKCTEFEKEISVIKPMAESDREELCEKCNEPMKRVYSSPGIQTFGDGYKS